MNHFVPPDLKRPDFDDPAFIRTSALRGGLDPATLERAIPNLSLMQTSVPADFRWGYVDRYFRFDSPARREDALAMIRSLDATPGFWSLLSDVSSPLANIHDRYWESAIGARGDTLSCDWLSEHAWRVSTLNPGGTSALSAFTHPLRFGDALGLSKGGFLVGTYGMEEKLAPFALAFRALPPVVLPERPESTDTVKVRGGDYNGTRYLYAVNTGDEAAVIALPIPPEAVELGTPSEPAAAAHNRREISLPPNSLRAWAWPAVSPPTSR